MLPGECGDVFQKALIGSRDGTFLAHDEFLHQGRMAGQQRMLLEQLFTCPMEAKEGDFIIWSQLRQFECKKRGFRLNVFVVSAQLCDQLIDVCLFLRHVEYQGLLGYPVQGHTPCVRPL